MGEGGGGGWGRGSPAPLQKLSKKVKRLYTSEQDGTGKGQTSPSQKKNVKYNYNLPEDLPHLVFCLSHLIIQMTSVGKLCDILIISVHNQSCLFNVYLYRALAIRNFHKVKRLQGKHKFACSP